jgi:deoxyribodipyrimidine photolyase-related protein
MSSLRLVLGDQLSADISSLEDYDPQQDWVLMAEVRSELGYVPHHQKKLIFVLSAMRHFAQSLQEAGVRLIYRRADAPQPPASFTEALADAIDELQPERLIVTHPGEYRVLEVVKSWQARFALPVEIREDSRFLCTAAEFNAWAEGRKSLRMEFFYREMRQRHRVLMDGGQPVGGQWNYDAENRKPPRGGLEVPAPFRIPPDAITQEVTAFIETQYGENFGSSEDFHFAVTAAQAKAALAQFIGERLADFGSYQDAMVQGEPWMFHAHIGLYLNAGLLSPLHCIKAAETAYRAGQAPLNAVEGFIRQILGWREYVRGLYWRTMPDYAALNYLDAARPLPDFYWTAATPMNCLHHCVSETAQHAYAHHIQRLMVLGNFALLAGIDPSAVNAWFLSVYADAYEWVELPNVSGMALFADGGLLASKPYAAGGNYINKMSTYCRDCQYSVAQKQGEGACPFNYLYWDFLARNRPRLGKNPRLALAYRSYDRMGDAQKRAIAQDSADFLAALS